VDHVELTYGTQKVNSELVEDVTAVSKKSFDDKLPSIRSRAMARMAVKSVGSTLIKQSGVTDQLADSMGLGNFKSLFKAAPDLINDYTESADTRTWALLPGNILMARLSVAPTNDKTQATATYYDAYGGKIGEKKFDLDPIKKGQKMFISDSFVKPDSIIAPASTRYASNSSGTQAADSFMFFGFGVGLDSGTGYTDFQNQIYTTSYSTGNAIAKPDLSVYLGGYSGLIGFELGYKVIGGYTDNLMSNSYNYCPYYCYQSTDAITVNGNATYYALLLRSSKTKNYVYLKAGLASTNMTIQESSFGAYANGQMTTTGSGSVLGVGWDILPLRIELESMSITVPTPTYNGFMSKSNTTTSTLTTVNFGLVF
jgi:hypothetical protein